MSCISYIRYFQTGITGTFNRKVSIKVRNRPCRTAVHRDIYSDQGFTILIGYFPFDIFDRLCSCRFLLRNYNIITLNLIRETCSFQDCVECSSHRYVFQVKIGNFLSLQFGITIIYRHLRLSFHSFQCIYYSDIFLLDSNFTITLSKSKGLHQ